MNKPQFMQVIKAANDQAASLFWKMTNLLAARGRVWSLYH